MGNIAADLAALSRSEDNQQYQFFSDFEEAMFETGFDKNYISLADLALFPSQSHLRFATDHVINLVFFMGSLIICRTRLQHINAGTHGGNAEKLVVALVTKLLQQFSGVQHLALVRMAHANAP